MVEYILPSKIEAVYSSEMYVPVYQTLWRHFNEDSLPWGRDVRLSDRLVSAAVQVSHQS